MGNSTVEKNLPTACTDGVNKMYGESFISKLSDKQLISVVLHENFHVALKHLIRFQKEFKEDPYTINLAADFVVNGLIKPLVDKGFCEFWTDPAPIYDAKYDNWSVREVYDDIRKQNKGKGGKQGNPTTGNKDQGNGSPSGETQDNPSDEESNSTTRTVNGKTYSSFFDDHDFDHGKEMTQDEVKQLEKKIEDAIRQGGILAGMRGDKLPRAISEMLEPKVDWREQLRDFVTSSTKGTGDYTWRKYNRRMIAYRHYLPSIHDEKIGDIVVAIDTSGSIGGVQLTEFATELASICESVQPDNVRVLWWDTDVHGEQKFDSNNYSNIAHMLKPVGGGGTHVSCVSEYITKNRIEAEAVMVFTDGYVETDIKWAINSPTMWMVTENKNLVPPVGQVVRFERD